MTRRAVVRRLAGGGDVVERRALVEERRLRRVEIFRRDLLLQRAAAERDDPAAPIADRKHDAVAEAVVRHRNVFAGDDQAGLDHVLDRDFGGAEMLLERVLLGRRIAEAEFELRRRGEAAVGEIAAAAGAVSRRQRRSRRTSRPFRRCRAASCGALRALPLRAISTGSGTPAISGQPFDRFRKAHALGLHQKVENVAVLARGEVEPNRLLVIDVNDGVFSLLNGDSPFHSRPALRNFTRLPTTSETGSRARSSSRNCGVKRMVIRSRVAPIGKEYRVSSGGAMPAGVSPSYPQVFHRYSSRRRAIQQRYQ